VAFDDPENPQVMDELLSAAGATCVDWPHKTECCGGNFSLSRPDVVCKLVNDLLREAQEAGAEVIAVACPLCQTNLDLRQTDATRAYGVQYHLPILYFTQLLGLALGVEAKALGLERLIVSPQPILQKLTARPESNAAYS
jgi:heterodisulfide reductase subunit B